MTLDMILPAAYSGRPGHISTGQRVLVTNLSNNEAWSGATFNFTQ